MPFVRQQGPRDAFCFHWQKWPGLRTGYSLRRSQQREPSLPAESRGSQTAGDDRAGHGPIWIYLQKLSGWLAGMSISLNGYLRREACIQNTGIQLCRRRMTHSDGKTMRTTWRKNVRSRPRRFSDSAAKAHYGPDQLDSWHGLKALAQALQKSVCKAEPQYDLARLSGNLHDPTT